MFFIRAVMGLGVQPLLKHTARRHGSPPSATATCAAAPCQAKVMLAVQWPSGVYAFVARLQDQEPSPESGVHHCQCGHSWQATSSAGWDALALHATSASCQRKPNRVLGVTTCTAGRAHASAVSQYCQCEDVVCATNCRKAGADAAKRLL